MYLCFAKDRLYLVEGDHGEEDDDGDEGNTAAPVQGRRVLVLSLQGDILQVVTHPTEPTAIFTSICCFDDTLLASYQYRENFVEPRWNSGGFPYMWAYPYGMIALQGL